MVSKKTVSDFECPICMTLLAEPVKLPCNHIFCLVCQKKVMKNGNSCPMCRQTFDKLFVPQVDKQMQSEISAEFTSEFELQKKALKEQKEWRGDRKVVSFSFGNTHEDVKDPKPANSDKTMTNKHRWTMFVSLASGKADQT